MNRFFLFIVIALLVAVNAKTQTIKEIRESGKYLYGLGESDVYEKADQAALGDLISQISVNVEDSLTVLRSETNGDYNEYARSVVITYSSATISNALRIEEDRKGIHTVVRYIPKENIYKIFENRKQSILNYTKDGFRAEWKLQIGDALRNFYWADVLLRSHPEYNSLTYCDEKDTLLLKVFLPNKINEIFSNIRLTVLEQEYKPEEKYAKYTIGLKYKNEDIQSLDYTYKYKNSWSATMTANNGLACIEYYGDDARKDKEINVRVAYMYKEKSSFDKDIQSVFSADLNIPYFSKCELRTEAPKDKKKREENIQVSLKSSNQPVKATKFEVKSVLQEILGSIEQKGRNTDLSLFTPDGMDAYNKLIKYGNAVVLKQNNELKTVRVNDETIVRSVPMKFNFSGNRQFVEDVVFIFNDEGKINDINFSLSDVATNDILSKPEKFATEEERYFLIRFMENYKTAYCLKRIDYLQKVFDEDALIIVGKVLDNYTNTDRNMMSLLPEKEIQYQRFSKTEYLSRLKRVFANQEFVNIHFEDNTVEKANRDVPIYGIQIAQHYTSATYADKGYLFLMIDLRDTLNPIVHVRTWQPQKNPDGSIYGLNDFPFQKL